MLRPIDADGTCRYSTGRPGRENAWAVAPPPTRPIRPGSATAVAAATVSRRIQLRTLTLTFGITRPLVDGITHYRKTYRAVVHMSTYTRSVAKRVAIPPPALSRF